MKKTRKINKFIVLFLSCLLLTGCNNKIDSNKQQDDIVDNKESNNETITIGFDVWDIDPVYEFDDIDVDFAFYNRYQEIQTYPYNYNHDDAYQYVDEGGVAIIANEMFGLMNKNGEIITQPEFDYFIRWYDDLIDMAYHDQSGSHEWKAGRLNKDYTYDEVGADGFVGPGYELSLNSNNEVVLTGLSGDDSVIDLFSYAKNENKISDTDIIAFIIGEDLAIVTKDSINRIELNGNFLIYDITDNIIMLTDYYDLGYHYIVANRDNDFKNVFYIDANGNTIASGYETGYPFYEGYAAVKKDGKWGYVDKQGNVVVDFIFDKATSLSNGKAWVIYNGKTGRLNIMDMINNNVPFTDEYLNVDAWKSDGKERLEVTADALKKRRSPTTSSDRVGRVAKGSILVYTDTTTSDGYTWYKLEDGSYIADQNGEWITIIN